MKEWRGMEEEDTEVTALCSDGNKRGRRSDDCQCIEDRNGDIYIGTDSNRVSLYSPGCPENSLCRIGWRHIQRCAAL